MVLCINVFITLKLFPDADCMDYFFFYMRSVCSLRLYDMNKLEMGLVNIAIPYGEFGIKSS